MAKTSFFGLLKALFSSDSTRKRSYDGQDDVFDDDHHQSRFGPYVGYNPDEKRWRIVGTQYEGRERYIIENKEDIECGVSFSREYAADHDPNAIAVIHNDKVLGFFDKDNAAILAPVFDKHHDKLRHTVSVWVGKDGRLVGIYIRLSTRFKVSKPDFQAAVEKCIELANRKL